MKKNREILFTTARIGSCEVANRFVMCPMAGTAIVNWVGSEGYDPGVHDLFVNRAKDGVGLLIPGSVPVYSFKDHSWLWQHPEAFEGVSEFMDELHSYGSKVFFQLTVGAGRNFTIPKEAYEHYEQLNPIMKLDALNASPDEGLPNVWINDFKSRQVTVDEIHELVHAMAETAWLCKQNGVDGVDVHAVHEGYLLDQFTLPYTNHRTDEYGGSLENRLRFACEIVHAIKERCGADYPVSLRYSVTSKTRGFNQGIIPADQESTEIGRTMEESRKAVRILEDAGYDAFNADNGTYDAWYYSHPPVYMPLNCNLNEVMEIKKYTSKPVICAGRMQLDEAATAVAKGSLDFVGIARQFLADEKFLTKMREGRDEDVIPCISCHLGCMPIGMWKNSGCVMGSQTGICALNPYSHNEKKYEAVPSKSPKNIAVIGGGIAGMEFALQADRRGHQVDLYEKSARLGGVFNEAACFSFKEKDRDLLRYYRVQIEKSGVQVHLMSNIASLDDVQADEYVIATGAAAVRKPKIDGIENATPALDFLSGGMECGDRVIIIGGGLTGCEIAYELAMKGKHPILVEIQDDILKIPGSSMANTSYLRDAFVFYKVPVYTSAETLSIREDTCLVRLEDGREETLQADQIIFSAGYLSGSSLAGSGNEHVHVIGDADRVSNLRNAIWSANDLVLTLA
ncbi:MAG: FAD-dependent oxidoreductase [Lachnospiraceae bacterium]|nr:FAD-dependent oxidoreductase [Lachnospiraceae bacterium]